MTQELSLSWDGTAIEYDGARVSRALFGAPSFGPLVADYPDISIPGFGIVEGGQPTLAGRDFSFTIQVTPKSGTPANARGEAFDELRNVLGPLLSPEKLRVKALWSRPDYLGAATESFLWARTKGEPGYQYTTTGGDGAYGMRPSGRMRVNVEATALYPYFIEKTPVVDATITTSTPVSVTNSGARWVGWRLEVLTSTANGNQITLTSGSQAVTLQCSASTIQVGTIVEYWYPAADLGAPLGVYSWRLSSGVYLRAQAVPQAGGSLVFNPGFSGSVAMTLPGTSSGTITANFKVHRVYGQI